MASVCMAVHLDHVLAYQRLVQYMYSTSTSTRCDYGDCPTSIGEAALSAHPSRTCRLRSHSSDDDNALMNRWAMMMRTRERERGRERTSEVKCNYRAPIPPTPTLHSAAAPLPPVRPHIRLLTLPTPQTWNRNPKYPSTGRPPTAPQAIPPAPRSRRERSSSFLARDHCTALCGVVFPGVPMRTEGSTMENAPRTMASSTM
jgi:hypothetical protein